MLVFLLLTVLVALLSARPIRTSAARGADLQMAQLHEATQVPLSPSATAALARQLLHDDRPPVLQVQDLAT
jgi:hypothetical protein